MRAVLVVAVLATLALEVFRPESFAALLQKRPWLTRSRLDLVGVSVLLLAGVPHFFTPGYVVFLVGLVLYAIQKSDAYSSGVLDFRALWRGWKRRVAILGVGVALFSLGGPWKGGERADTYTAFYEFLPSFDTDSPGSDAFTTGHAMWVMPLLLLAVLAAAYRPVTPSPKWSYLPFLSAAMAMLIGVIVVVQEAQAWEIDTGFQGVGAYQRNMGSGPVFFCVGLIPFLLLTARGLRERPKV